MFTIWCIFDAFFQVDRRRTYIWFNYILIYFFLKILFGHADALHNFISRWEILHRQRVIKIMLSCFSCYSGSKHHLGMLFLKSLLCTSFFRQWLQDNWSKFDLVSRSTRSLFAYLNIGILALKVTLGIYLRLQEKKYKGYFCEYEGAVFVFTDFPVWFCIINWSNLSNVPEDTLRPVSLLYIIVGQSLIEFKNRGQWVCCKVCKVTCWFLISLARVNQCHPYFW